MEPGAAIPGATDSAALPTDSTAASAPVAPAARPASFTVQFAAVLTEEIARDAAANVQVEGRTPRITTSVRDGRVVYRVVMGPFPTREDAERVGRASGRAYWVFEGAP